MKGAELSNVVKKAVLFMVLLFTVSPAIASDLIDTMDPQFKAFIGLPKNFVIHKTAGVVALVEGFYEKGAEEDAVTPISSALAPIQEVPLQVNMIFETGPNPECIEEVDRRHCHYDFKASEDRNVLTLQRYHYHQRYKGPSKIQFSGTAADALKLIRGYIEFPGEQGNTSLITVQKNEEEALLRSDNLAIQELITQSEILQDHQKMSRANYAHLKEQRAERIAEAHAHQVIKTFRYVAPNARIKLYHPNDFSTLSQDQDVQIASISTFITEQETGEFDFSRYDRLTGSNKIVVVGLNNNHSRLTPSHPVVNMLKDVEGCHVIVCSTSTCLDDSQLGEVGEFLTMDDQNNPDLKIVFDSYMTAPGVDLNFVKEGDVVSGCSLATPIVASAILHLKQLYPDASNAQIKQAVVQGGRKRPTNASEEQHDEKYYNHLDFSRAAAILASYAKQESPQHPKN